MSIIKNEAMEEKPYLKQILFKKELLDNLSRQTYPFNIPSITFLETITFHADVTFIVGENGSGKSTLIEAIALHLGFGPEGGTKNVKYQTANTISSLYKYLKSNKSYKRPRDYYFLRAETFYNLATYMDMTQYLKGYGGKSLHQCSHGESFMNTLLNKLQGNGLYIFDEPEAALSPTRQLQALTAINNLVNKKSQFIIATHSPILLAYPRAKIIHLSMDGIIELKYEQTEQYMITKQFLNNHEQLLKTMFDV